MKPPESFPDPYRTHLNDFDSARAEKEAYQHKAAGFLNEFICELSLNGMISEPASAAALAYGQLVDDHAIIVVASLPHLPNFLLDRTLWPTYLLKYGGLLNIQASHHESELDPVVSMRNSQKLRDSSPLLPTLVSSAYYSYWRGLDAEAISIGWTVVEKIIDSFWCKLVAEIKDSKRRKRLKTTNVYTASVRIEVLLRENAMPSDLCREAQDARKIRNDLVHKTKLPEKASDQVMRVMHQMIEKVCGTSVKPPTKTIPPVW